MLNKTATVNRKTNQCVNIVVETKMLYMYRDVKKNQVQASYRQRHEPSGKGTILNCATHFLLCYVFVRAFV